MEEVIRIKVADIPEETPIDVIKQKSVDKKSK